MAAHPQRRVESTHAAVVICYLSIIYFAVFAVFQWVALIGLLFCVIVTVKVLNDNQTRATEAVKESSISRTEIDNVKFEIDRLNKEVASVRTMLTLKNMSGG